MKVIVAGDEIELGTTEAQPTIGIVDYSRRETDDFGVTTVVRRGFARRMSVRAKVPFDQVDALQRTLADLRAQAVKWVADERFASLAFDGFYKDFAIDLAVPPVSFCTLTVEGLTETEAGADPGGDPATDGSSSTLRLLQPATIDDSVLTAINVPEDDQPVWSVGTTYPFGARVIRAHRQWESLVVANLGNEPAAGSAQWMDIGPTNRWAMFDDALGTLTEAAGGIIATLDPATPINALALLDITAASVRVQATGYDRTIVPSEAGSATFLDLPAISSAITVTVTGAGTVSVGTLMIGNLVGLGVTEASPSAGINDYSRKEPDDFGDVTVVERAWAKRMDARALLRTDAIDLVFNRIATMRGRPCLWIGAEGVEALSIYGFFKDFSIEVDENVSTLSLSIEGLSKAAQLAPLDSPSYLVTVFQNAAEAPAPPPINAGEVPSGWTLAPLELTAGQYRWSTQAKFLLGVQQTAWTQPVKVGGVSWQDIADDDPEHPKPEDGATVGATPEQAEAISHHTDQINAALEEIDGLIETYGTTVSAAASAALAQAEHEAAENAKVAAVGARDDASGFAVAAEGSASVAHDAEVAAAASAGLAAGYQGQADTFAQQAEESAATASDRAAAASNSATLAASYSTGGGNLLSNTDWANNTAGWSTYAAAAGFEFGRDYAGDTYRLKDEHVLAIYQSNGASANNGQWSADLINVEAGKWYEFSAWVASHRCDTELKVIWTDVNGTYVSENWSGSTTSGGWARTSGGATLDSYTRVYKKFQAPAGARRCYFIFIKWGTDAGQPNSWGFLLRPQVREVPAPFIGPAVYSPGSATRTVVELQASVSQNALAIATANTAIAKINTQVSAGYGNMLPNGDFSQSLNGYTSGGAGGWAVADAWSGRRCTTTASGVPTLLSPRFPVQPGTKITAGMLCQNTRNTNPVYGQFRYENAAGGSLQYGDSWALTPGGLGRVSRTTTVPAGAAYCRLWFAAAGNDTGYVELNNITVVVGEVDIPNATPTANVTQSFTAISDLQGRTAAYWQVNAAVPGSRAQLTVWADNAGAGVDIVGDVAISGGLLVDGTINGVKLQDLAVQTAKLANNAATVPVSAYTDGDATGTDSVWFQAQSVTITTTGAPVDIFASGTIELASVGTVTGQTMEFRILRNGTEIRTQPKSFAQRFSTTNYFSGSVGMTDNPISGTYTYSVEVKIGTSATPRISKRYLKVTELKK